MILFSFHEHYTGRADGVEGTKMSLYIYSTTDAPRTERLFFCLPLLQCWVGYIYSYASLYMLGKYMAIPFYHSSSSSPIDRRHNARNLRNRQPPSALQTSRPQC
jgi:hypothetical protein